MFERDPHATADQLRAAAQDSLSGTQDPRPDVHALLLDLAGRLDDDLLAWARELVAVGEEGQAVELVVAALVAERVALPAALRAAVVRAGHTDLDAEAALAPGAPDEAGHRFDATAGSGDRVAAVLSALPARRLAGCTLHLTWRVTPAGTAPGPVPRAVVLVETGPDRSADVLAYLLATELDRAGVPASVEVFTTGGELPAYHVAALRSAQRIEVGASVIAPAGVVVARTAAEAAARAEPSAPDVGPDTAALLVMPSGEGATPDAEVRRGGRRRRREPAEPLPARSAAAVEADEAPATDPFHGPLRVPLLAPLLEPESTDADDRPPAVPTPIRPVPAVTEEPPRPEVEASPDEARSTTAEPEIPDEVPQEWEDDWRSGDWATPHQPSTGPAQPSDAFDVFDTPAAPDDNPVEGTGRTELPSRQADRVDPELPVRARPDGEPAPLSGAAELPSRATGGRRREKEGGRPPAVPFGAGAEGTAAMPSSTGRDDRGPGPRRAPADVSLFDSPTARVGPPRPTSPPAEPEDMPLFGEPPRDGRRPDGPPPDRGGRRRRPDADAPEPAPAGDGEPSVLSSTERDLLAQLQAELADRERRPRPYRRARSAVTPAANGHGVNGHGVNGHGVNGSGVNGHGPAGPATPDPDPHTDTH